MGVLELPDPFRNIRLFELCKLLKPMDLIVSHIVGYSLMTPSVESLRSSRIVRSHSSLRLFKDLGVMIRRTHEARVGCCGDDANLERIFTFYVAMCSQIFLPR